MQYARLKRLIQYDRDAADNKTVTLPIELFQHLLGVALRKTASFDEQFYLSRYSDVRNAVEAGELRDGAAHYFIAGYLEDRLPAKILVDENFYVNEQPDIIDGLRSGIIISAQQHFEDEGFVEGRLPYAHFTLF